MTSTAKITRKRKAKIDLRGLKRGKSTDDCAQNEMDTILKDYQNKVPEHDADTSSTSVWMSLNVVLDHSSFQRSLLEHDASTKYEGNTVPLVKRAYEESFMRECFHENDIPCTLGQYCECNFIDTQNAFIGVAFVMPDLGAQENKMCILCLRKLTQMLYYRIVDGAAQSHHIMQTYGNICDVPGEYHHSAMLVMPKQSAVHCMPMPVVAHQRNKYSVTMRNGHRYLKQMNVYFEDFQ